MRKELTPSQEKCLEVIKNLIEENRIQPTIREIAEKLKVSEAGAYGTILILVRKKYIDMRPKISRSIRVI